MKFRAGRSLQRLAFLAGAFLFDLGAVAFALGFATAFLACLAVATGLGAGLGLATGFALAAGRACLM